MSEAFLFAFFSFLLFAIVLFFLMRALFVPAKIENKNENLNLLKKQLHQLEHLKNQNLITDLEFSNQKNDLEKRVLEENNTKNQTLLKWQPSAKTAWFLVVVLPIVSLSLYFVWGNPAAMQLSLRDPIRAMQNELLLVLKENPNDENALNQLFSLANELHNAGNVQQALFIFESLEKLNLNNADFLSLYASLLWNKNGTFKGKPFDLLKKAFEIHSNHPRTLLFLGFAYFENKELEKAQSFLEKAKEHLQDPRILMMIENTLLSIQSRLNPNHKTMALMQLLELKNQLKAQQNAPDFLEKGAPVWWILAKAAHNLNRYDVALEMFEEGKHFLKQNDAELLALYAGSLLREKKNPQQAQQLLKQAQQLDFKNNWVIFYSAFVEKNATQRQALLKQIQLTESSSPHLKEEIQKLKSTVD